MNKLFKFEKVIDDLRCEHSLPRYKAELIIAKASGALTMADLKRILSKNPHLPLPTSERVSITRRWLTYVHGVDSNLLDNRYLGSRNTMLSNDKIQQLISETVSQSIHSYFFNKKVKTTHMLDHIFPKERKIRSLIGGLETSMGTRVWEPLAKAFASSNGFNVLDEKIFNGKIPRIPDNVTKFISLWEKKKLEDMNLPLSDYWNELQEYISENVNRSELEFHAMPKGQGVDIILEKDGKFMLCDIKTTQINAGSGPKFLKNFLNWYAYLALMDLTDDAECFLAFPFNPHKTSFWPKEKGKVSPLIPAKEAYVGDEFWDQLTGLKGTTAIIESSFKDLGSKGFGEQFSHHFN